MTAVADTSPLNYLVLIGAVDVLASLFVSVTIPQTVVSELTALRTPASVRDWVTNPPTWLKIAPDPFADSTLDALDPGERAAISLSVSLNADFLLIDDSDGQAEAVRRSIRITGTMGVLAAAHRDGLLDFEEAIGRLSETPFYLSPRLVAATRRLLPGRDRA